MDKRRTFAAGEKRVDRFNNRAVDLEDRKRHTARWVCLAFIVMLLFQTAALIGWGFLKQGYHIDETTSYINSNGYYERKIYFFPGFEDVWHTPDYFLESLTAHADKRFSYATVVANVARDSNVHPPLFHLALHTALSLFPGTFSKWLGIAPNILYFAVGQIFLFLISAWFLGKQKKWLALLPCLIWGFSAGAVSMVLFIRMYAMLSMWILGLVYFHLRYLSAERPLKWLVLIGLFSFLSFMTHYYATVFVFFLAACFFVFALVRRGIRASFVYAASVLGGLALMIACWHTTLTRGIIGSNRSAQAVDSLKGMSGTQLLHKLSGYLSIVEKALFGTWMVWIFLGLALLFGAVLFKALRSSARGERLRFTPTDKGFAMIFLLVTGVATFLTIVLVAPYRELRYVAFLLPLLVVALVLGANRLAASLFRRRAVLPIAMAVLFAFITTFSYQNGDVENLYRDQGTYDAIIARTDCDLAVCFSDAKYRPTLDFMQFMLFDKVYITDIANIDSIPAILSDVDSTGGVVVYLDKTADQSDAIDVICAQAGFAQYKALYEDAYYIVYSFSM